MAQTYRKNFLDVPSNNDKGRDNNLLWLVGIMSGLMKGVIPMRSSNIHLKVVQGGFLGEELTGI